jgi:alkaline phosphatase
MKLRVCLLLSILAISFQAGWSQSNNTAKKPKNIILLIGDGMGLSQISAGLYANGNYLNLERFPFVGIHKSYSSDNLITDSAAGATAFSIGKKSYNGAIGVDQDTVPVKTILEEAEDKGWATGLVATSTITHATPASFIAHVSSRNMQEAIAAQFLNTDVDFFVGGGQDFFENRKEDDRNISQELREKGYQITDINEIPFEQISFEGIDKFGYFTAAGSPEKLLEGRDYLIQAGNQAVEFLNEKSDKGFFLMIEGSQIDWGGHANESEYIITEMIEFDQLIGDILDFAKKDGETLVVVTADHETGGYSINPSSTFDTIVPGFTTTYHTATMIPVFAYGPGSEQFGGIYENTAIYHKIKAALGW